MELASIKRRICAFVIDMVLLHVATGIILIIPLLIIACINNNIVDDLEKFSSGRFIIKVLFACVYLCYNTYFLSSEDQGTLGQKWMGISTISRNGHKINDNLAFYRTIPFTILAIVDGMDSMIPTGHIIIAERIFLLLILSACFNKHKQTCFDLLSDTLVIKNQKVLLAI